MSDSLEVAKPNEEAKSPTENSVPTERRTVYPKQGGRLHPFPPGVCSNPGGRPKVDLAAQAARLAFEGLDKKKIAKVWQKVMERNPKMLLVLAERAYGKLKIPIESSVSLHDMTDDELKAQLDKLTQNGS